MCTSDADQNLSANLLLHSTISFFVLSRTPKDTYYNALLLPETTAVIHIFYDKQVEFLPLMLDARAGRVDAIGLFRLALASPVPVHRPITIQNTLRSAFTNRLRHPLNPRYHCSTSYIQPRIDGVASIDLSLFAPLPPP